MSDAKKSGQAESKQDTAKPAKKRLGAKHKQIIIFAVAGLVFIGLIAGGSMVMMKSLSEEDPEVALESTLESNSFAHEGGKNVSDKSDNEKKDEAKGKSSAIYLNMQPAFVTNFEGTDGQHFIQVEVTLMSHTLEMESAAKTHMPLLRNALVMLLGSQSFDDLQTSDGKEKLRQQALLDLQAVLKKETGESGIEDVFFTSIVMQ